MYSFFCEISKYRLVSIERSSIIIVLRLLRSFNHQWKPKFLKTKREILEKHTRSTFRQRARTLRFYDSTKDRKERFGLSLGFFCLCIYYLTSFSIDIYLLIFKNSFPLKGRKFNVSRTFYDFLTSKFETCRCHLL